MWICNIFVQIPRSHSIPDLFSSSAYFFWPKLTPNQRPLHARICRLQSTDLALSPGLCHSHLNPSKCQTWLSDWLTGSTLLETSAIFSWCLLGASFALGTQEKNPILQASLYPSNRFRYCESLRWTTDQKWYTGPCVSENKVEQVERWKILRKSLSNLFCVSICHSSIYWVTTVL